MRRRLGTAIGRTIAVGTGAPAPVLAQAAGASAAYGTLNDFDGVNDTGVEAHGFDIEPVGIRCTDITYTYDDNRGERSTRTEWRIALVKFGGSLEPNA